MKISKSNKVINLAVWGVGNHAIKNVLPAIAQCDSVNLIGLHTRNQNVLMQQSDLWSCEYYKKSDHMLSDDKVEAVYISTSGGAHRDNVFDSLKAKKHVLCEKPITGNYTETIELVNIAQSQNLLLMESTVYVHHPQFEVVRRLIKNNKLGKLKIIASEFGFPHLNKDNFRYKLELGGGALFDAGFYPISFAVQLMDQPAKSVVGNLDYSVPYKVDTSGTAILKFKNGVQAFAGWGFGMHYRNEATLWGTKGIARIARAFSKPGDLETNIILETSEGAENIIIKSGNHFVLMLSHFASITNNMPVARKSGELSLYVASIMDEIFSQRKKQIYS